ncbi:hypothetical protein QOZ80_9AG0672150 [Eleusine coracana subsp. coracana]|nr:hypothetical protein QOZ80_9AG0672150 [Eleusine coracana subsp. coracana]
MEAVIGTVAAFQGKVHFTYTESNQEKMCVTDLDFPPPGAGGDPPPSAALRKFHVPNLEFPGGMCSGKVWLVESQEELLAVGVFFVDFDPDNIGAVRVYKMDFCDDDDDDNESRKKEKKKPVGWRMLNSVGDRAFLLSGTNMATWCSAAAAPRGLIKGNAVYFLKNFWTDDGDLCVYDLEEHNMEIVRVHDQPDLVLPRTKPYWINVPPS